MSLDRANVLAEVRRIIRPPTKERDPKRRFGYYHYLDRPQCLIAKQFSLQSDLSHVLDITALLITKAAFNDIQVIVVGEVGVPSIVPELQHLSGGQKFGLQRFTFIGKKRVALIG